MLRPCSTCHRHVATTAIECPFCASRLATAVRRELHYPGRLGRAAIFAGAVALAPAGCGDPSPHYRTLPTVHGTTATTGQVTGRALRHDGSPAVGAFVTLYGEVFRNHPSSRGLDAISMETDRTGTFRLDDVPPGDYRCALSGRGRQLKITVRAGEAVVVELTQDKPSPMPVRHVAKPYGAPPARRRIV